MTPDATLTVTANATDLLFSIFTASLDDVGSKVITLTATLSNYFGPPPVPSAS